MAVYVHTLQELDLLMTGSRVEEVVVKIKVDRTFLEHGRDPSGLAIQSHISNADGHCIAISRVVVPTLTALIESYSHLSAVA